jgi:hypothetical protein
MTYFCDMIANEAPSVYSLLFNEWHAKNTQESHVSNGNEHESNGSNGMNGNDKRTGSPTTVPIPSLQFDNRSRSCVAVIPIPSTVDDEDKDEKQTSSTSSTSSFSSTTSSYTIHVIGGHHASRQPYHEYLQWSRLLPENTNGHNGNNSSQNHTSLTTSATSQVKKHTTTTGLRHHTHEDKKGEWKEGICPPVLVSGATHVVVMPSDYPDHIVTIHGAPPTTPVVVAATSTTSITHHHHHSSGHRRKDATNVSMSSYAVDTNAPTLWIMGQSDESSHFRRNNRTETIEEGDDPNDFTRDTCVFNTIDQTWTRLPSLVRSSHLSAAVPLPSATSTLILCCAL